MVMRSKAVPLLLLAISLLSYSCEGRQLLRALTPDEYFDLFGESQIQDTDKHAKRHLDDDDTFVSYFLCEYDIVDSADTKDVDLTKVVNALVTSYNNLVEEKYNDPLKRKMESAELLTSNARVRRAMSVDSNANSVDVAPAQGQRRLLTIIASLSVFGSCTGCSKSSKFSNQLTRQLGESEGLHYQYDAERDANAIASVRGIGAYSPDESDDRIEGVPTEAAILEAYSEYWIEIASVGSLVLDVLDLSEEDAPEEESDDGDAVVSKGGTAKSAKSSSGKDGKGGKDGAAKSSKASSSKGSSKGSKAAKSSKSKGGSKGDEAKLTKGRARRG